MKPLHIPRRAGAVLLAAGTLWAAAVTAGSESAAAAAKALWAAAPIGVLRWETGDLWRRDGLSAATALAVGEAPLLRAARPAVVRLLAQPEPEVRKAAARTAPPSRWRKRRWTRLPHRITACPPKH